jgi:hypothetical protein
VPVRGEIVGPTPDSVAAPAAGRLRHWSGR